ncbi:hypothetical protein SynA1560_02140 [Synechococcus sp. A15-60]|nr:hypothetical protein SynA1560_02140 [Synechococcus sp. A15-60]
MVNISLLTRSASFAKRSLKRWLVLEAGLSGGQSVVEPVRNKIFEH